MRFRIPAAMAVVVFAAVASAPGPAGAVEKLKSYNVDIRGTSVSGVSSGAYMAGQLHVAYSSYMVGAGLVAGGPYDCSNGSQIEALLNCFKGGTPEYGGVPAIEREAKKRAIDDPLNLANDRVYIFTGAKDTVVGNPIVAALAEQYRKLVAPGNLAYVNDELPAGHAFITRDYGKACAAETSPYLNDCDYDQAGVILRHIYGELREPAEPKGRMVEFDQSEFNVDPQSSNLHTEGYAYIPTACEAGERCRIHVAVHGCEQSVVKIGDDYYRHAGFNGWAEANNLIILYPQTTNWINPMYCWDFFAYTTTKYATREGEQVKTVMNMVKRLAGEKFEKVSPFWNCGQPLWGMPRCLPRL